MCDAAAWAESEAILFASAGEASPSWDVSPISASGPIPADAAILSRPISCVGLKRHVGNPFEDA